MIDASTQTDLDVVTTGNSTDGGISETETGKKIMIDAPTEAPTEANGDESAVDSSSNDGRSSPVTLVNTPTDHSSQVDVENNEQDEEAGSEDVSPEAHIGEEQVRESQNAIQELRDENAKLRSSVEDLANALSQEREKAKAAEERAAAAEERRTVVAERATGLGTHMQSLGQGFGTQVTRAANAEAEAMRMRVQMWDMQRDDFLAPDEEPIQEHGQPSNDLDQSMEQNNLSGTPLNAQEHSEDHESRDTQIEETLGDFQDVTEDLTAADSTPMVQEALLSIEVAAHQRTREELIQLKAKMTEKDSQLQMSEGLLREAIEDIEQLRAEQDYLQTLLDNADLQISKFDVAYRRLTTRIRALQTQVDDQAERLGTANFYELKLLEALVKKNSEARKEAKERKFFMQLAKKLYDRVKKAEKLLRGALGRDDDLMRLAEQRLPKPTPSKWRFREIQLAIEGPPADSSAMQNTETFSEYEGLLDDVDTERLSFGLFEMQDGTAVDNDSFADVEAVEPAYNNFAVPGPSFVSGSPARATESAPHDIAAKNSGFAFSLENPAREIQGESEGSVKKPVFNFGGTPVQGSQRKAEGATKKPVFAFGGTNARESQQKAECAAKKPVNQFFAPPVQEARQEKPLGATTSPQSLNPTQKAAVPETSGVHVEDSTHDHTLAPSAPRVCPFAPVTLKAEEPKPVGTPVDPTAHLAEKSNREIKPVPEFNFGGAAPVFRAQTSPNPVLNSKADSGSFNFTPRTDFNFGATNAFKAGPSLSKAAPKAFGVAKDDEQEEGPTKKNRTTSKFQAPSFIDLSSSSSVAKEEEEEATKKTKTASIFDAAASVNLSSPSSDGKAPIGAPVDHDPIDASKTPKSTFTGGFNFPGTSTKEDAKRHQPARKTQTIPIFGAGTSNQFSFSPRHITTTFDGFKSVSAGNSIAPSGDDIQAEVVSLEPTQGFSSTLPMQLPGLSVGPDSSSSVHSAPTITGRIENRGDHQRSDDRMGEKKSVGAPSDEVLRTSSTSPSTSEGRVEGEAADVLAKLGFDAGVLTRIVASVTPAVQENLGGDDLLGSLVPPEAKSPSQIEATEPGGDVRHGHFKTAAEAIAVSATADGVNGQEPPTASILWREPVWPAELPPSEPEPEWSAVLTRLAGTPTTATQPPASTQGAASRKYQNIEEAIDAIMDGIASLHIGSAMPPGGMQRYEPYVLLSGDWIERQYTIRRTIEREVEDIENKVETREKSLTQTAEAREVEVTSEDVRHKHQAAGESEPDVTESPTPTQLEIGNKETSATEAGEAQEAMPNCEQQRGAEPEFVVENELQETGATTQSHEGIELETALQGSPQMRAEVGPQMELQMEEQVEEQVKKQVEEQVEMEMEMEMELQMEDTATAQAPESTAGPSRESREQTNDTPPPKKPSGGLRIWSLRKQR